MQAPGAISPDLTCQLHTLDNGLRLVLHREPSLPLVAVNLWYHVGSKNERPGRTGLAHLFEHMLFQGSEHVPIHEHFRQVQKVGGVLNGSTWYDRTNYYQTLPAHHLELGLWLESDRMGFLLPAITQQSLETQRDVVMNERRQRVENQPYGRAGERLHELLYPPDHPYHWPVIGYLDDIAAATLEEVRVFFRTYYTPNNAVLTLAGDLDPAAARELAERWFGDLPRGPQPRRVAADAPPLAAERREELADDVRLARVYFGFRAPRYGDPRWYAGDLLAGVLAAGKSSVLYRDLVYSRQLAQEVGVHLDPTELGGTFYVVATAKPGVAPEALAEALAQHLAAAAAAPPEPDDFERARNKALTDIWGVLQKLDHRADLLSQYTTYFDDPGGIGREVDRYARLRPEELVEFAAETCRPERRVTLTVVPREEAA
ncbi:MAG TPA: pitrilysin family protein [Thermoanaerobaculia bacterium]|nr:pitrilysin family protein [Thermoanaerobaculia bacterium]